MTSCFQLLTAEAIKLRRSAALRVVWALPLVFSVLVFLVYFRPLLGAQRLPQEAHHIIESMPIKILASLWAGFFHLVLLSLLPSLLVRIEHKSNAWKHLHAQPVSRRLQFGVKAVIILSLFGISLGLVGLGLRFDMAILGYANPSLVLPFPWKTIYKVIIWLYLGSIPLLALYLWLSDRINSSVVPIALGLIGLVLTVSLSGAEVDPSWRRDLIPWVLPYICAQHPIDQREVRQDSHLAGSSLPQERDLSPHTKPRVWQLPSGRKATQILILPERLFRPPIPTPTWLLFTFSAGLGLLLLGLGWVEAGRNRT